MTAVLTELPGDTGTSAPTPAYRLRWLVAVAVLAANLVDILDGTIVNVAGPSIRRDLGGGGNTIQWLSAGYTLAFAVFLIAGARLGDIFGRRRLFLLGLTGFTVFSTACSLAPDMTTLIAARALQGGFGALLIPQGFGLLKEVFSDDREFDRATGFFGPVTGLAMLGAPVLAGVLVDANLWGTDWRLVFLINVPIGLLTLAVAAKSLPRGTGRPGLRLDVGGMVLIGAALVALIYPLIQGQSEGWPAWTFGMLAVGLALLAAFALYERRRGTSALIEPSLLRNRRYLSGVALTAAVFGAFGGVLLCVSLYGQLGEGWSPIRAGLTLTPMVLGLIAGMLLSLALVARLGRHLLHVGVVLMAAGAATLAALITGTTHASVWHLVPGLVLLGLGLGFSLGQLFRFILSSVTMDEVGSASGVLEAVQQMSNALGVAVLGTIFFGSFGHHLPSHALAVTAWSCLAPLAVAFALVFLLPMQARDEAPTG